MSRTIFLDTGPLGILTNPKRPQETLTAIRWAFHLVQEGHQFIVPAIADYELRRELERGQKRSGIAALDAWNQAEPGRYLPLTDTALKLGSKLWAQSRNAGTPTEDVKELDGDVLIAAQALDFGLPLDEIVIATTNVRHLAQFAPAMLWAEIRV